MSKPTDKLYEWFDWILASFSLFRLDYLFNDDDDDDDDDVESYGSYLTNEDDFQFAEEPDLTDNEEEFRSWHWERIRRKSESEYLYIYLCVYVSWSWITVSSYKPSFLCIYGINKMSCTLWNFGDCPFVNLIYTF